MMHNLDKEIRQFLLQIKKNLVCPRRQKKEIIRDISNSIYDYTEEHAVTDIREIYDHFGDPKEIARQLLSEAEPQTVRKAIDIRKAVIVAVIITLAMLATTLIIELIDAHDEHRGNVYIEGPIEVTEE
ncbi:MAG: hypothetical protein IJ043_04815 [Clostridia bacterium]|nr:hypothetical protein [Clostridia bacterium]